MCKVGDFGLSQWVPDPNNPNDPSMDEFVNRSEGRPGTVSCLPPEQLNPNLKRHDWEHDQIRMIPRPPENSEIWQKYVRSTKWFPTRPRLGTPSNVWQIGWMMHWTICRYDHNRVDKEFPFKIRWTPRLKNSGVTFGRKLVVPKGIGRDRGRETRYSRALRALILECLLGESDQRPLPEEIIDRTERALAAIQANNFVDIDVPDDDLKIVEEERPHSHPEPPPPQTGGKRKAPQEEEDVTDSKRAKR